MSMSRADNRKSLMGSDPVFSQSHTPAYTESYDPIDFNQPSYGRKQPSFDQQLSPSPTYNPKSPPRSPPDYNMDIGNANSTPSYDPRVSQGYGGHREELARSATAAPPKAKSKSFFSFVSNKWAAGFFGVTVLQAIICLCFEIYIFVKFTSAVTDERSPNLSDENLKKIDANIKTIPTFLTLFIFGFLYELLVVWDALRAKNTIQIIGVCIANLALVVYTAIQVDQISMALHEIFKEGELKNWVHRPEQVFKQLEPSLIAIPIIIAVITVLMAFLTWKLYQEFAWDILKAIGADYRMKKRLVHYQIYLCLLKFDFFFFLGFIIQLVVIVTDTSDPEFYLTIVTIPITILILVGAGFFTRRENKVGMVVTIILYLGGLSYFCFKLARIHSPDQQWRDYYYTVRRSLTAFAAITILLILLTIANAIVCMLNFNKGLKEHVQSPKKKDAEINDPNSVNLTDVKPQGNRMTIE